MITDREKFCCLLSNGPLLRSDAIVVLCGEDANPRLALATQIMRQHGAHLVVLSGGKHEPPRWRGADALVPELLGAGVSNDRILRETSSMNTRQQAVIIAQMAVEKGWKRLLLVASPYHVYRAFLTFLRALQEVGKDTEIQLLVAAASQSSWFKSPEGMDVSRLDLLSTELCKIEEYGEHVATYEEGLNYLAYWETHQ